MTEWRDISTAPDAEKPLDIREGVIHYWLYGQDGRRVPLTCRDTHSNRLFVRWVRQHDRNTVVVPAPPKEGG